MNETAMVKALDEELDLLGEQIMLNLFTQICLCYSLPDASSKSAIVDTITKGIERLSASFPLVAGKVIVEPAVEGKARTLKIKPLEKVFPFVVKDFTDDSSIPSMDDLRQAKFPFRMLDESIVAPRNTLPTGTEDTAPVFLLQANFVRGGVLLTFVGQHNAMDMVGQAQIISLLSKACRNEEFTQQELLSGNLERRNLIPLLEEPYKRGKELDYQIAIPVQPAASSGDPSDGTAAAPPFPPKCIWTYFIFSPDSLTQLKRKATESLSSGYVSTDDTLTAFIWQSISRARLPRLDPTIDVSFGRAVDVRRYLGIPSTYTGIMQNMTYSKYPLQTLIKEALGCVASTLRAAVDPKTSTLAYDTRSAVTYLSTAQDRSTYNFTATLNLSADLMFSSWSKVNCYDLDFNLGLGKPEAVRRPRFIPVESLIYSMPKRGDGEIAVGICLREDDMKNLMADEEFSKYTTYVG